MPTVRDPENPTPPSPVPPPMKDRQKAMMTAFSIAIPILRQVFQVVTAVMTPEPRTCPKCSYRMVDEVAHVRAKGKHEALGFWRCSACASRYKTVGEGGPFRPAPDDEWRARVHVRFPR
jgi:hypothetical protein